MVFSFLCLSIVLTAVVAYLYWQDHSVSREMTGTIESFRLTWGQQGQQILNIDGVDYNIWLNWDKKEFHQMVKGNVVTHHPYYDRSMGKKLLCTRIIDIKKKNNNVIPAPKIQPGSQAPSA